jgi:Rrf2 family transcriptional regulator, nitric oxide-sensitive transcriptional repressor
MMSQTAEYALRAALFLAANPGEAFTTQQISEATRAPAAYLSKVLKALVQAQLVLSQRGTGGGFMLKKQPGFTSILEVINAVETFQRVHTCPLGLAAHGSVLCSLHKRLDEAMAMIEQCFAQTTLAELLEAPTASKPLCDFPGQCRRSAGSEAGKGCDMAAKVFGARNRSS